ncbi:MAG: PqqD family protein [Lapillicoccus sp.]
MTPAYRRPHHVAMVVESPAHPGDGTGEDTWPVVYLAHLPTGSLLILEGTGALIYIEAVADGSHQSVVQRLADRVGLPQETISGDVDAFIAQLVDQRLLEIG